jgi:hypothetical protein
MHVIGLTCWERAFHPIGKDEPFVLAARCPLGMATAQSIDWPWIRYRFNPGESAKG